MQINSGKQSTIQTSEAASVYKNSQCIIATLCMYEIYFFSNSSMENIAVYGLEYCGWLQGPSSLWLVRVGSKAGYS